MVVDVSSGIEPRAGADVQGPEARAVPKKADEPACFRRRGSKRKPGRSPGALSDAVGSRLVEARERGGDIGAGETAAALDRRKIIADAGLKLPDRRTEALQVAFGD